MRQAAIERFAELGMPTTRDEEYRFTNVEPDRRDAVRAPRRRPGRSVRGWTAICSAPKQRRSCCSSTVVRGPNRGLARSGAWTLPQGVTVTTLSALIASGGVAELEPHLARIADFERSAFSALNTALFEDAAIVFVAPGAVLEAPGESRLRVDRRTGTPTVSLPADPDRGRRAQPEHVHRDAHRRRRRHVFLVRRDRSRRAASTPSSITTASSSSSQHGYHYCRLQVRAKRSATFLSHAFSLGGAIVRNDLGADLVGEGIDCTLNGLYLADGDTLVDNHTTIDHAQPHCGSHEVYKGILGGRARGVFNGKIIVAKDAQKTDAKQTNKAMLLSDVAQMNTKPQLEIFADDVKCTHGATVGQLDADSLFYLQARGLDRNTARGLLIRGFAGDVVERVKFGRFVSGWIGGCWSRSRRTQSLRQGS